MLVDVSAWVRRSCIWYRVDNCVNPGGTKIIFGAGTQLVVEAGECFYSALFY